MESKKLSELATLESTIDQLPTRDAYMLLGKLRNGARLDDIFGWLRSNAVERPASQWRRVQDTGNQSIHNPKYVRVTKPGLGDKQH
jgi:hypothetical protein